MVYALAGVDVPLSLGLWLGTEADVWADKFCALIIACLRGSHLVARATVAPQLIIAGRWTRAQMARIKPWTGVVGLCDWRGCRFKDDLMWDRTGLLTVQYRLLNRGVGDDG